MKISAEHRKRIAEMHRQGAKTTELAAQYGVHVETIRKHLRAETEAEFEARQLVKKETNSHVVDSSFISPPTLAQLMAGR